MLGRSKKNEAEEQSESATLSVIKNLMDEEVCLTGKREELLTLKRELQLKAKDKIETVTSSIQKLKSEVQELTVQCEQLKQFISNSK